MFDQNAYNIFFHDRSNLFISCCFFSFFFSETASSPSTISFFHPLISGTMELFSFCSLMHAPVLLWYYEITLEFYDKLMNNFTDNLTNYYSQVNINVHQLAKRMCMIGVTRSASIPYQHNCKQLLEKIIYKQNMFLRLKIPCIQWLKLRKKIDFKITFYD